MYIFYDFTVECIYSTTFYIPYNIYMNDGLSANIAIVKYELRT